MPSNVEIKARVNDVDRLLANVLEFADTQTSTELIQEDTFFHVSTGRLKLRQLMVNLLLLLVCVSLTITGQPRNSVLICRV